jgi:hypothetical protein
MMYLFFCAGPGYGSGLEKGVGEGNVDHDLHGLSGL